MKLIPGILYREPVIALLTINAVVAALAAEGRIAGWISVVVLAGTAPLLRRLVSPDRPVEFDDLGRDDRIDP